MANLLNPSALILMDEAFSGNVLSVIERQLAITYVVDGYAALDGYFQADGYFKEHLHADGYRVLVLMPLYDFSYRDLFDIVLTYKNGLISVEKNLYGPHGITMVLDKLYLTELFLYNIPTKPKCFNRSSPCCPCDNTDSCKCKYWCYCKKVICRYPFS